MTKPLNLQDPFTIEVFEYLENFVKRSSKKIGEIVLVHELERAYGFMTSDARGFVEAWSSS